MKQFFFGVAMLGFVLSVFALAWQYESNRQLRQEIVALKGQSDQILQRQMRQKQTVEKNYAAQIGSLKNTVSTLDASINQNERRVAAIEEEKAYKSGEKSFLYTCEGMKGISSHEFFDKAYFDDVNRAVKNFQKAFPKPAGDTELPDTVSILFPWVDPLVNENFFVVSAMCEDGTDVYIFSSYSAGLGATFLGVGKFSFKTRELDFTISPAVNFYMSTVVKEKDSIRFVPRDLCVAGEQTDAVFSCSDPNILKPSQKIPQDQVSYNIVDKTFAVVNP